MILINFAKTMSPYFGSGRIIVFSATLRLDIVYLSQFIFLVYGLVLYDFGRFAPYLDRPRRLSPTPEVSSVPLTVW